MNFILKRFDFFFLILILIAAFYVRMYKFNGPVADWQSWRQADTSSVSRDFVKYGFDILHPRFHDLSKGVSLLDNPQGYRFVEFPIYNIFQAGSFVLFERFTIEEYGRLVTIVSSLISIIFIYLIARKYISIKGALAAACFYAFIPYSIFYGRVILPDTTMVTFLLGSVYFFDKWTEKESIFYLIFSTIFFAISLLLKPFALFFGLPFAYLIFKKYGINFVKKPQVWLFFIISILPLILWRLWMNQYPEGIPQNTWLFNGTGIRFKGAFFHWIFAERISNFILGYFGLPFVILGFFAKMKKEEWLFYAFACSSLIYLSAVATGNVQHDYYQILIIPTLAFFFAKGMDFVLSQAGVAFNKLATHAVVIACILFMLSFSWFRIRDYYSIQHPEIVDAGLAIDEILPKDVKVIAPYNGDTAFLYQTNRRGWPVVDRDFKDFVKAGAKYIVFANPTKEEIHLENDFVTVKKTNLYAIFDLTKPLKPLK